MIRIQNIGSFYSVYPSTHRFRPFCLSPHPLPEKSRDWKWVELSKLLQCVHAIQYEKFVTPSDHVNHEANPIGYDAYDLFIKFGLLMEEPGIAWPDNDPRDKISFNYIDKSGAHIGETRMPSFKGDTFVPAGWSRCVLDFMAEGVERIDRIPGMEPILLGHCKGDGLRYIHRNGHWNWNVSSTPSEVRLKELGLKPKSI